MTIACLLENTLDAARMLGAVRRPDQRSWSDPPTAPGGRAGPSGPRVSASASASGVGAIVRLSAIRVSRGGDDVRKQYRERPYTRLSQPMVREHWPPTARHLGRGARPCRRGVPASCGRQGPGCRGCVLVLEGDERDELHRPEVRAHGHRHEQHRLLQPHLTRSLRRRSGDSLRSRRRDLLLPRGGGHRRHHPLGLERPGDPPDLLPPRHHRRAQRRAPLLRRPPPDQLREVGRRVAGNPRRDGHRPLQHDRPRDHPRRTAQHDLHRPRHERLRGVRGLGGGVDPGAGRGGDRGAGRGHRRAGPHLRPGRSGPAVLDARHHRAPQRRRQRPGAHQPRPAVRPRRPLRLRAQPVARAEQRAGRRRHGRHPEQAAGLPGHPRRRGSGRSSMPPGARTSRPGTDCTCRACSRPWSAAISPRST